MVEKNAIVARTAASGRAGVRGWAAYVLRAAGCRILFALCLALTVSVVPIARSAEDEKPAEKEAPAVIVREIEVRGNMRVDTGTILRMIRTRVGRPFDQKVWDEDWHRLADSGYFLNVRVTPLLPWPGGGKLVIDLIEMATIKKIEFKGSKSISTTELRSAIKSTEGGRYQMGQVHMDARALEKFLHDKAFRDAKVTYEVTTVASHKQRVVDVEQDVQDEVAIAFTIDDGHPVAVAKVDFKGNKAYTEAQLVAQIQSKPRRFLRPGDLKDAELDIDKKRLEHFYLRNGYMDVSVDKTDVQVGEETYWNWFRKRKKLADVTFYVTEGPQYHVGNLTITGNKSIELSEIQAVMNLRPGAVFSDLILSDDADRIKQLYGEYGRVFTRIEQDRKLVTDAERIQGGKHLFDVEIRIIEGAEVALREIITRGNTKTKDKVLIRQIELFPGDRLDTRKTKFAEYRLKNLQYFEDDVRITTEPTDNPEEANLVVDVTEKPTGEFNFGVGVSSAESLMGNVSLTQRNFDYKDMPKSWRDFISGNAFTGAGQRFSIEATAGTKSQRYNVSFFEPWAFDRPIRLGGSVFHSVDQTYEDFDQTDTGFSVTAGKRLWGPRWDGDLTYKFVYSTIGDTDPYVPPLLSQQEGDRILSSLTARLVYDSRDSNMLPSRGWMMEASLELGGGPLLGDVTWVRPTLDISRYFTMVKLANGGKHIIELRAKASMVESYGNTDEVPPFLRYYGGGVGSIRGFESRTVAPIEGGYLIGGKKSITASAEYSMPLYEEIVRGSIFLDVGQVWDAGKTDPGYLVTNESGIRASAGVGLAIRTPLSPMPIRVYFSHVIKKNENDQTKSFDFTFGTRF
jgi:outer membrane protein insertion porin family